MLNLKAMVQSQTIEPAERLNYSYLFNMGQETDSPMSELENLFVVVQRDAECTRACTIERSAEPVGYLLQKRVRYEKTGRSSVGDNIIPGLGRKALQALASQDNYRILSRVLSLHLPLTW
jgi:hypothetical protein